MRCYSKSHGAHLLDSHLHSYSFLLFVYSAVHISGFNSGTDEFVWHIGITDMKLIKIYAIVTVFLQAFLWVFVRRAAIDTRRYLQQTSGKQVQMPLLSELVHGLTPYAWAIPAALLMVIILQWKKNDIITIYILAATNILFLIYLAMCAIGFTMPFIPKMSEFRL